MPNHSRPLLATLLTLAAACAAPAPQGQQAVPVRPSQPLVRPPVQPAANPLETIARCEALRTDGDGLLQTLAAKGDERTRECAVRALGRIPRAELGEPASDALAAALRDPAPRVRARAAFGLGLRADPASLEVLLAAMREADTEVRARVTEALSRIDDERARRAVLTGLDDAESAVRAQAALGAARFPAGAPDAPVADAALAAWLRREGPPSSPAAPRDGPSAREAAPPDVPPSPAAAPREGSPPRMTATRDGAGPARPAAGPQERWCGLFALARRKAARARSLFVHAARTGDARERIFAAQGLGAVPADENSLAVLRALLADPDWRVAAEAASALGKHADVRSVAALGGAARREVPSHAAQHLRAAAATALGTHGSAVTEALAALEAPLADVSPNVRGAALIAWARLAPESARAAVERAAADEDSITRAAAALACPHLHWGHAQPILERLLADAIPRVRAMAGEALGQTDMHAGVSAMLRDLLESDDNALRLAAALAHPESAAALNEELLACLETTHGEIAAEVAQACVAAAAKMPGNLGQRILEKAARHTDPYVARRARALLGERFPDVELPDSPARRAAPEELPPLVWDTNPIVHVETSRGTLTFELYPDETPAHVWNLLELARAGHYDGLTFHRVVPDFVIQGGDHRGDGNGGVTWNGAPLLAELGPRPFVRGSLGMPRNDDPDSGGSQLFVTHRETPHLDGHYTLFGQLTAGFDVLDSIEVGDRIVSVRVEEPAASTPSSGD